MRAALTAALTTAVKATELTQRAPLFELSKDGVRFAGADGLSPVWNEQDQIDRAATAKAQGSLARDYGLIAVTPEKALIGAALGAAISESAVGKTAGVVIGATLGAALDVLEAIPNAALAVIYGASAGVNALRD